MRYALINYLKLILQTRSERSSTGIGEGSGELS